MFIQRRQFRRIALTPQALRPHTRPMTREPQPPIRFADFHFDPSSGELTSPQGAVRLGPLPAQLLATLASRPGELVTRAELKATLWPDTTVEADQGLNACIRQLRVALGDDAGESRIIETLPRRGYRFIARIVTDDDVAAGAALAAPQTLPRAMRRSNTLRVGLVLVIIFSGFLWRRGARTDSTVDIDPSRNVAVLPIAASVDAPWTNDIASGVTDRLVARLTNATAGAHGIVGPVTTRAYANDTRPHTELGAALKVGYVASGNVRLSDSTVFIQVVRVSDGVHVFAFRRRVVGVDLDALVDTAVNGMMAKLDAR